MGSRGQVGWIPRLVGGEESRPCNYIHISRKLRPLDRELHSLDNLLSYEESHAYVS